MRRPKSAIEHKQKCQKVDQENPCHKATVEATNAARTAEFERAYKSIETANRRLAEDWEAKTRRPQ